MRALAFLFACLSLISCATGDTNRPFARVNVIAWDDTDADISATGYGTISGETDHQSVEVAGGLSMWDEDRKLATFEAMLAGSEFLDLEAVELSAGGRYFFGAFSVARPYASAHAVSTVFDQDLGVQLGFRAGLGTEIALSDSFFLDLNMNYLFPLLAAEDEVFGLIESEVEGVSMRVGFGYDF